MTTIAQNMSQIGFAPVIAVLHRDRKSEASSLRSLDGGKSSTVTRTTPRTRLVTGVGLPSPRALRHSPAASTRSQPLPADIGTTASQC